MLATQLMSQERHKHVQIVCRSFSLSLFSIFMLYFIRFHLKLHMYILRTCAYIFVYEFIYVYAGLCVHAGYTYIHSVFVLFYYKYCSIYIYFTDLPYYCLYVYLFFW